MVEGNRDVRRYFGSVAQRRIRNLEKRICELEKECTHDRLTGLLKSDDFEEQVLMRMEKMSHKNRSDDMCRVIGPTAIIFIDVDHFKEANDTLGHNAGDEMLRILANIIRNEDLVTRRSGDEFLMALFYINKEEAGDRLVGMRRQFEIASKKEFPGLEFPVSFSFGVKEVPSSADMALLKQAVSDAELEMYRHKKKRGMGR